MTTQFNKQTGELVWGDITYSIVNQKGGTLIIEKKHRYGIYFTDIKTTTIKRKMTKQGTIRLEGYSFCVNGISGLNY